ncbi:MAG: hypothetical protein HPY54_03915 [Chthonomonadetes bacterium]|nr:hypothetical protein [Chthonomonadetes bacterium]
MQDALRKVAPAMALFWVVTTAHADGIAWLHSYDEALKQAKENNRVVMIDFYTDW